MDNYKSISRYILLIVFYLSLTFSYAQYYSGGQDPASLTWNHIQSENFQVVYPRGYDSIAQYVINVMEYGRKLTLKTKEIAPRKISIILHNQTVISNAEVAWAPRRMEIYTTTPQSTYSQEWFQQLALHEYMHVIQISSMRQGLTNILYYLFGEQITVGIFGLYVPYWFVEGEAVVSETALSKSGRGRDPGFEAQLRAQLVEKGAYSLEKASLGSYEDFVPDRYHLGYYLVAQGRAQYGKNMWNYPMLQVGKAPLSIVPFSNGINKETGYRKKAFYDNSLAFLQQYWTKQVHISKVKNYQALTENNVYCDYTNHSFVNNNKVFSLKKDLHKNGVFVLIDSTGNQEEIFRPGYYNSEMISTAGDWVCWSERQYDARWNYRTYNKILLLNIKSGKKTTLVKKTRYFSPSLSPSGEKIAVVEVNEFSQHALVILDRETGAVSQTIKSNDNDFIAHPAWSADEKMIVAEVMNKDEGKALAIFKLQENRVQQILAYQHTHLQYPSFWKKYILFEAAYSGVMDIFALDLQTKSLYQTTKTPYSASDYAISPNGKKQVFSSYTANGKQLQIKDWDPETWIPMDKVENHSYALADILSLQEEEHFEADSIPEKEYEVKKYSKLGHLVNIHSWNFLSFDADYNNLNPGINILSQNKLATMSMQLGANYNTNSESWDYSGQIDYLGSYVALSIGAEKRKRFGYTPINKTDSAKYYYHENSLNAALYLPLSFTNGLWSFSLRPEAKYDLMDVQAKAYTPFSSYIIHSLQYRIYHSGQYKTPWQNIFPRWGYSLSVAYNHTPFSNSQGEMFSVNFAAYLPGFFRHDGSRIMIDFQDKIGRSGFYNNQTAPARGYSGLVYNDIYTIRYDYRVPIAYPDWNISSILYLKRITIGGFYDISILCHEYAASTGYPNSFWSTGIDITANIHLLRSKFPFEIGLRTTYLNEYIENTPELSVLLLFGVSL